MDEQTEPERRWEAVGSRARADRVLLRARLADLAREGRMERAELPSGEPLARLVDKIARSAGGPAQALADVVELLERESELREGVRAYVTRLFRFGRLSAAIAETGLLPGHGLFAELRERMVSKFLPSLLPPSDLRELFTQTLGDGACRQLLEHADGEVLTKLLELLEPTDDLVRARLVLEASRALDLLSHRLAAGGEDPTFASLDPSTVLHESPFLAQAQEIGAVTAALRERAQGVDVSHERIDAAMAHASVLLKQCAEELARFRRGSPRTGATIRATYELDRLEGIIDRMSALLLALGPAAWGARASLFRDLLAGGLEPSRVTPLLLRATRLVAREIVSHAGRTGDHYITRTRAEWGRMWLAAAGGGLIVAFLAVFKGWISALHLPPLLEAIGFSLNYSLGFIVVLYLGLTIATKQPAFTAAALSQVVDESGGRAGNAPLIETIARLVRSQLAAILGNVLAALPIALLLGLLFTRLTASPIIAPEKAAALAAGLHPVESLAWPHAALTGIWLTIGGICAGAVANTIVARRVVERVRRSEPLRRRLGAGRVDWLARQLENRAGPIAGCLVLGFLLGTTGTVGRAIGLDVDIRHVSFASASFGLSVSTLGSSGVDWTACLIGIAGIGVLNLAVSFGCSLAIAWHARRPRVRDARDLATAVLRSFAKDGIAWLLPIGPTARPGDEQRPSASPTWPTGTGKTAQL